LKCDSVRSHRLLKCYTLDMQFSFRGYFHHCITTQQIFFFDSKTAAVTQFLLFFVCWRNREREREREYASERVWVREREWERAEAKINKFHPPQRGTKSGLKAKKVCWEKTTICFGPIDEKSKRQELHQRRWNEIKFVKKNKRKARMLFVRQIIRLHFRIPDCKSKLNFDFFVKISNFRRYFLLHFGQIMTF